MVSSDGLKPRAAPQSPCVPPTSVCPLLRGPLRGPRYLCDRPLRGDEFRAAYVADGSRLASRGRDLAAGLLPHRLSVAGRDAVVVCDADEFNRLKGAQTGELLIEALQASPHREIEIEPHRSAMPVRAVKL